MAKKEKKVSKFKEANTVVVKDHKGVEHRVWKGEADIVKAKFAKRAAAAKVAKK